MEIIHVNQADSRLAYRLDVDLFLAASGYEKRCTYLYEKIHPPARRKVVIGFSELNDLPQRLSNDNFFLREGFEYYEAGARDQEAVVSILEEVLPVSVESKVFSILVDYSCMTKDWYAAIFDYLQSSDLDYRSLDIYFSYTPARYARPRKVDYPDIEESISREREALGAGKPLAVILGLGYEAGPADEMIAALLPDRIFAFFTDDSIDPAYQEQVLKNHAALLKKIGPDRQYRYPLMNLKKLENMLTVLALEQRLSHQVVFVPLGPKPFTMTCLLVSAKYPDLAVWKIHSGRPGSVYEKTAGGDPIVCHVVFCNDAYCI